jgi:hypothetical protein
MHQVRTPRRRPAHAPPPEPGPGTGLTFEDIVFKMWEDATEAFAILAAEGPEAALSHLAQWHRPGQHKTLDVEPQAAGDEVYRNGAYVLSWNRRLGYISLIARATR